ncbi:MAG: CehA/McbA family metallohydrolase, partial [Anaerolineae bacterium]|nr:CehA/McbA family metallohydrolase [Anaerolineae bacterium]
MYEYVGNLHAHTTYSDGEQPHDVLAAAAIRAGLDFLVVTDHNVLVGGVEGHYRLPDQPDGRTVLLLTGEEVHDTLRDPQQNHLLVYGTGQPMAPFAQGQPPQALLDVVNRAGGCAFIAHPTDRAVPWIGEASYRWVDWGVTGYTGLELWNTMSTLKELMPDVPRALWAVFFPARAFVGPDRATLKLWDDLLRQGRRVAVIGNSDAHGTIYRLGPLHKTIFPYEFLFRCANTHVLLDQPLSGNPGQDGRALFGAIARGRAFVGYGLAGDPRGFRFTAAQHGSGGAGVPVAEMGDAVALDDFGVLRITAP